VLNNFDANGNLLNLNNIGNLEWHYNNTLNKLTKANKPNTIQHYVYDYQGKRVLMESQPSPLDNLINKG
jgi:insecticidal toxin complex protein TccC